jgi:hypothetical protein
MKSSRSADFFRSAETTISLARTWRDERMPALRPTRLHLLIGMTSSRSADWLEDYYGPSSGYCARFTGSPDLPYCRILSGAGFRLPGDAFLRAS